MSNTNTSMIQRVRKHGEDIENLGSQLESIANKQTEIKLIKDNFLRYAGNIDETGRLRLVGIDESLGYLYAINLDTGNFNVSYDKGVTWTPNRQLPSGIDANGVTKIIRFKSKIYLIGKLSGGTSTAFQYKVWSATPTVNWNITWTEVFSLQSNRGCLPSGFNCDSNYIFLGEYDTLDSNQQSHKLYRSADGITWETMFEEPYSNMRHIHGVNIDPYVSGSVWVTSGDPGVKPIIHSSDYGVTWNIVTTNPCYGGVQISFCERYVYFAGDGINATVVVYDKKTNQLGLGARNHHYNISVPKPKTLGDRFTCNAYIGCVDKETGIYYCVSNDDSSPTLGTIYGLFYLDEVGGRVELIDQDFSNSGGVYVYNGCVWCGTMKHNLISFITI